MTGRERLLKVLRGEKADRIPVAPFIFNNFIYEFFKSQEVDPVEKGIEVYEYFGFDIILRTANIWACGDELHCDSKNWRVSEMREDEGNKWTVTTVIKTPEHELTQRKRYNKASEYEVLEAVVEYFIKDEKDFKQFLKYQPPVPLYDCSAIKKAKELIGDKGLIAPWAQGAYNSVSFYRKLDDLIVDPFINPEFYHEMITYFSGRMFDAIKQFVEAGADIICCGGNVANSTMVGPVYFKEYVLPYEIAHTKKVKDLGAFYLYHNCGDAAVLLDLYQDIGMDIYESLTSAPYGDTVLEDALLKMNKSITLSGNIDQIDFLKKASPEEIKSRVREVLETVKPRSNFILAATDYFSEGTPYENIRAFADAGREYGVY